MASRNIHDLADACIARFQKWDAAMQAAGLDYIVTCTARDILEQMALYVQGRLSLEDVNRFRAVARLPLFVRNDQNAHVVTWTLTSKHTVNPRDLNARAKAFDIAIVKAGKPVWDLKVNVNNNELMDYTEAGALWEVYGGKWGGRFGDPAHMEEPT